MVNGSLRERTRAPYDLIMEETDGWEGTVHFAAWRGDPAALVGLIAKGADVNAPRSGGRTPLMEAVDEPGDFFDPERAQVVQLLLAAGASVSAADDNGWTALRHGTRAGPGAVVALLEAGAEVDAKAVDGSTPLQLRSRARQLRRGTRLARPRRLRLVPEPLGCDASASRSAGGVEVPRGR